MDPGLSQLRRRPANTRSPQGALQRLLRCRLHFSPPRLQPLRHCCPSGGNAGHRGQKGGARSARLHLASAHCRPSGELARHPVLGERYHSSDDQQEQERRRQTTSQRVKRLHGYTLR